MTPDTVAILATAVALRDAGCTVVPTRKDGGKAPAGRWKDYQTTPPTGQQIADWFTNQGHTGIGIITGKASNSAEMAELEGRGVEAGMFTDLEELALNSGLAELWDRITQGWLERTPSGGYHWYYRVTDGIIPGNTKLAADADGLVIAETRGEGGFSVVAPSHGNVHPSGKPWEIVCGGPATMAHITWEEREAFLSLFRALGEPAHEETAPLIVTRPTADGLRPGDDYNARTPWADILTPRGWTLAYTDNAGVSYWTRPGKEVRDGISATTGRNDGDNLYIFSSSIPGLHPDTAYSKFAYLTITDFGGDYPAAARALSHDGYGDPATPTNDLTPLPTPDLRPAPALSTQEPTDIDPETSTWAPVDLAPYYLGTYARPQAVYLTRDDNHGLLYPGRIHSFYGESESGKSWLAQIACAQVLAAGEPVVYIDFEADPADITHRLNLLGIAPNTATTHLRYIRPEGPRSPDDPHWQELLNQPASLVIIDGVTEALTMWGGETKDNDAITRWTRTFPRAIARATGAAVVTVDHVTKNTDTRGRFAIGGQAKLATIDGAAYLIEPLDPLAPGMIGRLTIRVTKDRPGAIRAVAGMWRKTDRTQEAAVAVIDATGPEIAWAIERPKGEEEVAESRRMGMDRAIIDHVLSHRGLGFNSLTKAVKGDEKTIRSRLYDLIDAGFIDDVGERRAGRPMILMATERAEREYSGQLRALNDAI